MPAYLDDHNPIAHGTFSPVCVALERMGGVRVRATDSQGTYHAYRLPDGRIVGAALVAPSAAKAAADAARAAARAADRTAEQTRADQVAAALAKLEDGTATLAEVRQILARVVRFIAAHRARDT